MQSVSSFWVRYYDCSQKSSVVCTAVRETAGITRIRSYGLPNKFDLHATICDAALATSAVTSCFDPVSIGAHQFVGGALGVNNPADEVEGEAVSIWCSKTGDLKPLVKCFISIGAGHPGTKAIENDKIGPLSKTLVGIATETEKKANGFIARWRQLFDERRCFRFNVQPGLQGVGLAEYKEQDTIETVTHGYLSQMEQRFQVRDCVLNLKQKQSMYIEILSRFCGTVMG
jgi:hypothetical protein